MPKKIWDAINWNGSVEDNTVKERPSNDEFKIHFERLLDPPGIEAPDVSAGRAPYIPLLDDPFTSAVITDAIQTGKVTRSGGPSGIPLVF